MRRLSQIILFLGLAVYLHGQSPHGEDFTLSCDDCHTAEGWKLLSGSTAFDHNSTAFPLEGLHQTVNCKSCHSSLVFSEAKAECMACHTDMHNQTVGFACERCHTPRSWIVENITEIHQLSRFPLLGPHNMADCYDCHLTVSLLEFQPLGIECIDCHQEEYMATSQPNHTLSGFSTDCSDCHSMNSFAWVSSGFNHDFFPLSEGHAVNDCSQCHKNGDDYSSASPECYTCHLSDYSATTNPNHYTANISNTCDECHTTQPGWKPAEFELHDAQYFPIYSGSHNGEWISCAECHTNSSSYAVFTCIDCHDHNQPDMDDEHEGIGGYFYNSQACFECHPTGDEEGSFNHNASNFPLTGTHTTTECSECHAQGYAGTPTVCFECHSEQFNLSTNPNHLIAEISNECDLCHSTAPDWIPATFDVHNEYYALTGAHAPIANDCYDCHAGDYINTTNECAGCHTPEFNETTNPNHVVAGISNNCESCHTTQADWAPATFPVHDEYYPLTGAHTTIANDCFECHAGDYNNTPNECAGCHIPAFNGTTNPNHVNLGLSNACESCHTTQPEWNPAAFPVHNDYYLLEGAHAVIASDCYSCHAGNYNTTPSTCYACHTAEYNQTNDPPHASAQFPTTCEDCHTQSAWEPSTFEHDGQYFPIYSGKHQGEWDQCSDCHNNPGNYAVFTCLTCHTQGETDNDHDEVQGYVYESNACLACHPDGDDGSNKQIKMR